MNDPETDFVIKDKLEKLFTTCINNTGVYREYTDEELLKATFIFCEILLAKTHKQHKDKVDFEGLCTLAEHAGEHVKNEFAPGGFVVIGKLDWMCTRCFIAHPTK